MYKANSKELTAKAFKKGAVFAQTMCIMRFLRFRFECLPKEIVKSLKKIKSTAELDFLFTCAMKCSTLDEFVQTLRNASSDHAQ